MLFDTNDTWVLVDPSRWYSRIGLGWGKHFPRHMVDMSEHHCIQHMRSVNFLIIATPLSHACQQHLLGLCVLTALATRSDILQCSTPCTIATLT